MICLACLLDLCAAAAHGVSSSAFIEAFARMLARNSLHTELTGLN